ncbi:hypothetical protein [Comamonas sp. JC664]|uniref:hypothetical protein n=1 Tax=Comamonas sp. JC664 TaxID=2801917 RepID=UPI00174DFB7E|nr:hypothetical protein [Comamonas sp. JC664]MBL0697811.1 hypothetical protein [Comamonas sp. JC664]GHG69709.1 hypothetical protein GCM10012319_14040 [Comamonas sp. KCTC 72670]
MTTLTVRTNPMQRSHRNNLWPQFDAASGSFASIESKCLVGFAPFGGHPPAPC